VVGREVEVEHLEQVGRRHVGLGIEAGVGKDVQQPLPGRGREVERVQVGAGGDVIELGVGLPEVEAQHGEGSRHVDLHEVADPQRVGTPGELGHVEQRRVGQPGEGLVTGGREDRVVGGRLQEGEFRVHPPQQLPQVVVLAEEGVEAPLHFEGRAVPEPVGPGAGAAAEKGLALEHGHPHAPLGQHDGGSEAGEAAADDHGRGGAVRGT